MSDPLGPMLAPEVLAARSRLPLKPDPVALTGERVVVRPGEATERRSVA